MNIINNIKIFKDSLLCELDSEYGSYSLYVESRDDKTYLYYSTYSIAVLLTDKSLMTHHEFLSTDLESDLTSFVVSNIDMIVHEMCLVQMLDMIDNKVPSASDINDMYHDYLRFNKNKSHNTKRKKTITFKEREKQIKEMENEYCEIVSNIEYDLYYESDLMYY